MINSTNNALDIQGPRGMMTMKKLGVGMWLVERCLSIHVRNSKPVKGESRHSKAKVIEVR